LGERKTRAHLGLFWVEFRSVKAMIEFGVTMDETLEMKPNGNQILKISRVY